tara:strand:- start:283 stop:420 length:138 start_codon:yes stop_codon:yes gene_type:complete
VNIRHKAKIHNIFLPYLSINVDVYGVKSIEDKPKVAIIIPISDLE